MAINRVFFGTNRAILSEDPPRFGVAHNTEKPYHFRVGEAEVKRLGGSWEKPDAAYTLKSVTLYPESHGGETDEALLGSATLFETLRRQMIEDPRDVIVFLHGFACEFDTAMMRAAEIRDQYLSPATDPETGDLKSRGRREPLVFAFSWPSDGVTVGSGTSSDGERKWAYSSDREDARASGLAMARCALKMIGYLAALRREDRCSQRIHLVAHSMGNWALRHAVQGMVELADEAGAPLMRLFDNAFLMASDINDDALEKENWLAPLDRIARRIHVYHAFNDSALSLSDVKPGHGARLGHYGPANMARLTDRVSAVDCSHVSWTPALAHARHQYYRIAPEVVSDVREVLAGKGGEEITGRVSLGAGRYRIRLDDKARKKLRGR